MLPLNIFFKADYNITNLQCNVLKFLAFYLNLFNELKKAIAYKYYLGKGEYDGIFNVEKDSFVR